MQMSSPREATTNNGIKQLRLALKVAAKNWLLLLLLPAITYGYARLITHQAARQYGRTCRSLVGAKGRIRQGPRAHGGHGQPAVSKQGPDIANQIRILKSRDLVGKAVGDLNHNVTYFIVASCSALPVGGLSGVTFEAFPDQFSCRSWRQTLTSES